METGSLVTVNRTRSAVTYQFHEKNLFYTNGYKLLQNSYKSGFVKCNKGMMNGNIRLTYDISGYVTLASVLPELDSKCFLSIACSLLRTVLVLRDIGFFQRENISIDPNDIFIEKESMRAYLIYVPINVKTASNAHMTFEKNIRVMLINAANSNKKISKSQFVTEILNDLLNVRTGIQEIITKIEMQALQTTDANAKTKSGLRDRFSAPTKNAEVQKNAEQVVSSAPAPQGAEAVVRGVSAQELNRRTAEKSYDIRSQKTFAPPVTRQKKQMSEKKKRIICDSAFFIGYCFALFAAVWIIAHYYSNSGVTPSFIGMMVGVLLVALLTPVFYLTRKSRKDKYEMPDTQIMLPVDSKKDLGFIPTIVMKNISSEIRLEFFINKKEFVIGKLEKLSDGYIPFDKTVSDVHCKVVWDGKFYIQDLDSDYGTFVNDDRVIPGQMFPLHNGDKVRISRHVFLVSEI